MNASQIQPRIAGTLSALVFVSAFALFIIQPVLGEILTPAWGGTPTVWLSCLLFFQTALFMGYFLAWMGTLLFPRGSFLIYCINLIFGIFLLLLAPPPFEPETFWVDSFPTSLGVIGYLGTHLLVVVLGISTTSTLAHHFLGHLISGRTTQLYSYSNAGSFLALLAYPLVIEPNTTRLQQIHLFTFLVCLQTILAFLFWTSNRKFFFLIPLHSIGFSRSFSWKPGYLLWLLIPICTSALLCGVTNHISTEIASVPFLWILPLALYLLSYVIAFGNCPPGVLSLLNRYLPVWVALLFFFLSLNGLELSSGTILVPLFIHLGCFFVLCILLHYLLHEKRPKNDSTNTSQLGAYYAIMSFGGLLGTLLQTLVFPIVFSRFGLWEYPLALAGGIYLLGFSQVATQPRWVQMALPFAIAFFLCLFHIVHGPLDNAVFPTLAAAIAGILFFACIAFAKDKRTLATSLILSFLGLVVMVFAPEKETEIRRNSFGVLKIVKTQKNGTNQTLLYHGNTIHGIQSDGQKDSLGRFIPLSYYGSEGPAGDAVFKLRKAHPTGFNIGIIGLGVGSMAWFGRPQDRLDFFELDPAVGEVAENPKLFDFLNQCTSPYRIFYGDGRRSIKSHPDRFDLLVLDAFSSDTVPIHLLTREAMEVYWAQLEEHGSLLCHVSNRHFELLRLMKGWELTSGQTAFLFDDRDIGPERVAQGFSPSQWVLFTKNRNFQRTLERDSRWQALHPELGPVFWTDDHHSILGLLKW